jgi:hypothetical protein
MNLLLFKHNVVLKELLKDKPVYCYGLFLNHKLEKSSLQLLKSDKQMKQM